MSSFNQHSDTPHTAHCKNAPSNSVFQPNHAPLRGVLHLANSQPKTRLSRVFPSPALRPWIEQYWQVEWQFAPDESHWQRNLPDPSVGIIFEQGQRNTNSHSYIIGPVRGLFQRELSGSGKIIAVKFHPGGFYPWFKRPLNQLTDNKLPLEQLFDQPAKLQAQLFATTSLEQAATLLEQTLQQRAQALSVKTDVQIPRLSQAITQLKQDATVIQVSQLATLLHCQPRQLQRLCRQYLGMPPKWLIRKYRIHHVLHQIEQGCDDWLQIVLELGYSDQAHFIKEFKTLTGITPAAYWQQG